MYVFSTGNKFQHLLGITYAWGGGGGGGMVVVFKCAIASRYRYTVVAVQHLGETVR